MGTGELGKENLGILADPLKIGVREVGDAARGLLQSWAEDGETGFRGTEVKICIQPVCFPGQNQC